MISSALFEELDINVTDEKKENWDQSKFDLGRPTDQRSETTVIRYILVTVMWCCMYIRKTPAKPREL